MDIRDCVKFYDEDDLYKLKLDYQKTAEALVKLASHKINFLVMRQMNDLLEYVDGNGFSITYNDTTGRYVVKRGER